MTKVLVLLGGDSPERDIAIWSGKAVFEALVNNKKFEVKEYDPCDGEKGLVEAIEWADVVLPILHGVNGEDGVIQDKIESLNKPFLGADSKVSKVTFDKARIHGILEEQGILMPRFATVNSNDIDNDLFTKPFVLKPISGGSSIDTLIVRTVNNETRKKALRLLDKHEYMLLEELVAGLEITVGVLDGVALKPIAIIPPENEEFDRENKYNGKTQEIVPIPNTMLSEDLQSSAESLALQIHNLLSVEHLSRVDMIATDASELVVLELNTMPGMTAESLFKKAALVAGYDMNSLTEKFVVMALDSADKKGKKRGKVE